MNSPPRQRSGAPREEDAAAGREEGKNSPVVTAEDASRPTAPQSDPLAPESLDPGPEIDRPAQRRSGREVEGVLAILDELDQERPAPMSVQDHHRWRTDQANRREALAIVERLVGTVEAFLDTPQPDLGDRTGRELLEQDPGELLRRLRELEGGETDG